MRLKFVDRMSGWKLRYGISQPVITEAKARLTRAATTIEGGSEIDQRPIGDTLIVTLRIEKGEERN